MLIERVDETLARRAAAREDRRILGAWNIGRCVLQNWLMLHGAEGEKLQPRALAVFELGDRVEDSVLALLEEAVGIVRPTRENKDDTIELEVVPGFSIRVRCDAFTHVDGQDYVVEVKSMSNFAFERAEQGILDDAYLDQAECYCRAYGVKGVIFFLYRKETSHYTELIHWRDDDRWALIQEAAERARADERPERPYQLEEKCSGCGGTGKTPAKGLPHTACSGTGLTPGGPFLVNFPCGYCPYKAACWEDQGALEMVVTKDGRPRWRVKPAVIDVEVVQRALPESAA